MCSHHTVCVCMCVCVCVCACVCVCVCVCVCACVSIVTVQIFQDLKLTLCFGVSPLMVARRFL